MKKSISLVLFLLMVVVCGHSQSKLAMNVMTFNIRYNNLGDSLNSWEYRKDVATSLIKFYDIDLLGTQEVLHGQMEDFRALLPEYVSSGVGREDGKQKGEYSAVFYKKNRFTLLNRGNFWLSEDPTAVGKKGWDAACERIVSWVHLKDKKTGKDFFFFNTHFDHIGEIARKNSSSLLLTKIATIAGKKPAIITGDFNSEPFSQVYADLTNKENVNHLKDTQKLALVKHGTLYSFHDFGRIEIYKRPLIDYIFVKNINKVSRYGIIADKVDNIFLSDHNPITVSLEIE